MRFAILSTTLAAFVLAACAAPSAPQADVDRCPPPLADATHDVARAVRTRCAGQ
jgi:hypothetical protein